MLIRTARSCVEDARMCHSLLYLPRLVIAVGPSRARGADEGVRAACVAKGRSIELLFCQAWPSAPLTLSREPSTEIDAT